MEWSKYIPQKNMNNKKISIHISRRADNPKKEILLSGFQRLRLYGKIMRIHRFLSQSMKKCPRTAYTLTVVNPKASHKYTILSKVKSILAKKETLEYNGGRKRERNERR